MKRFVTGGFIAACFVACGSDPPPKAPAAPVSDRCPDLTKTDELSAFDFAKEYALSAAAADQLKAAALATLEVEALSERLDGELGSACAQVAHDLGSKDAFKTGNDACMSAIKAVQDTRAKLGAKTQAKLVVRQPVCLVEPSLVTKCASLCDSSVPAEKVHAECLQSAGRCDGNCDGSCEPKSAIKCDGTCSGTCDGAVNGLCGGRCVGTCDGKKANGMCLGTCVGTCTGGSLEGECKGQCTGTCQFAKPGICDAVCIGKCSVELAEAKCTGTFKAPEVSTDCRARCELLVMNKTECSDPLVGYVLSGYDAKAAKNADTMKVTLDKAFPELMKIIAELGPQGSAKVLNAQKVIESVRTSFKELSKSGTNPAKAEAQLKKCFDEPFKKASADAATAKTGIDQAIGVRDEAIK